MIAFLITDSFSSENVGMVFPVSCSFFCPSVLGTTDTSLLMSGSGSVNVSPWAALNFTAISRATDMLLSIFCRLVMCQALYRRMSAAIRNGIGKSPMEAEIPLTFLLVTHCALQKSHGRDVWRRIQERLCVCMGTSD